MTGTTSNSANHIRDPESRREFLRRTGAGLLAVQVAGVVQWLTPRAARAAGAELALLTAGERETLESLGDILLPGAAEAGIAHFIDHHVGVPPGECLLMLRYLDVPPPYLDFYRAGLSALDQVAEHDYGKRFAAIPGDLRTQMVRTMSTENPAGWSGPPAPFFYYVVRADAVDVIYGTEQGFAMLDVPYLPHIPPPAKW